VWGNPGKGTESKYLLVGLAACGVCGAGLSVISRRSGPGRGFRYHCTANHLKGATVCGNTEAIPMAALDRTVLAAVERQVLAPEVIERTLERAMAEWARPTATDERDQFARALAEVETELGRLVVQPTPERPDCYAEVTGTATIGKVSSRVGDPSKGAGVPNGIGALFPSGTAPFA